jgi:hypothetical protein
MLLKSQCRSFVGFDDGSQLVIDYNPEMWKVLTSHNFHFLTPPEEIAITPDTPYEGELGTGTQNAGAQGTKGSIQENAV